MYQFNKQPQRLPYINSYQSSIELIPKKQESLTQNQNSLQVGFDPYDVGIYCQPKQFSQNERQQYKRYIDEFPAHYLDLLPIIPQQKEQKQTKNYIVLQILKHKSEPLRQILPNYKESKIERDSTIQLPSNQIFKKPIIKPLLIPNTFSQIPVSLKSLKQIKQSVQPLKNISILLRRLQKQVRILIIVTGFQKLLLNSLKAKIEAIQKSSGEEFRENISTAQKQLQDWVKASVSDFLKELLNNRESLKLKVSDDESIENKKQIISQLLISMMKNMHKVDILQYFTKHLAFILSFFTQSYQFAPKQFYFKFQMQRIKATSSGSIGEMKSNQQKMVLLILLILRSILFNQVMKVWKNIPNQEDNEEQVYLVQTNSVILVSIMHHIIISWIEKNVPRKRGLDMDKLKEQFQYIETPLTYNQELMKQQQKAVENNQLIDGILPSKVLSKYIYNSEGEIENWVSYISVQMMVLIDQIQDQLNKEFLNRYRAKDRICSIMAKFYLASLMRRS